MNGKVGGILDSFFMPQDLVKIQVEQPQKEDNHQEYTELENLDDTQSKGHSGLATFYGTGFGIFIFSLSDNNFRKSVMICQIIDSVDNHFGEYL